MFHVSRPMSGIAYPRGNPRTGSRGLGSRAWGLSTFLLSDFPTFRLPFRPGTRNPEPGTRRHAFTVVELLVMIAIMSVLFALLMPALGGARFQARITKCQSQERQIAMGSTAHASDSVGEYLRATNLNRTGSLDWIKMPKHPSVADDKPYDSRELLLEYVGAKEVFYCPDSDIKIDEEFAAAWGGWDTTRGQIWISYSILAGGGTPGESLGVALDRPQFRALGDADWFRDGIWWALEDRDATSPSEAPFLADTSRSDADVQNGDPGVFAHNHAAYITPVSSPIAIQHDSTEGFHGGNTTYFDGHTEWKRHSSMDNPRDTNPANPPSVPLNPDNDDYVVAVGNTYHAF
jgi:competence protein ComGC